MKVSKTTKRTTSILLTMLVVLTLVFPPITGALTSVFGALSDVGTNKKYYTSYESPEALFEASAELNLEIAREGNVLMKNINNALPLAKTERKVTVLGSYADQLFYGGGGSGGQFDPGPIDPDEAFNVPMHSAKTIFDSLDAVGIKYNPIVKEVYKVVNPTGITGGSGAGLGGSSGFEAGPYMKKLDEAKPGAIEFAGSYYERREDGVLRLAEHTFGAYNDAAIVVISRSGAEGGDNATHSQDYDDGTEGWVNDPSVHYLELQEYEKQLIALAKSYFSKIIVVLNSPAAMELGDLQDDNDIDAILWIGQPGYNGIMALGEILTGEVNPSGRLVDFYMRDFTKDPTFLNFGNNAQANGVVNGTYGTAVGGVNNASQRMFNANGTISNYNVLDYAEGIYMGYRYYETVYAELVDKVGQEAADEWYAQEVVYPFGHGLSYTTFEQSIKSIKIGGVETDTITENDGNAKITVTVSVKNAGSVAGKEVVQVYSDPSATYIPGRNFEKAAVNLVGFAKTPVIEPGETVDVDVVIPVKELADFDYNGVVFGEDKAGYVLEAGAYTLSIRANSHDVYDEAVLNAEESITWDEDGNPETPNNIFSQPLDSKWAAFNTLAHNWTVSETDRYLKRTQLVTEEGEVADLNFLAYLLTSANRFKAEAFNVLDAQRNDYSYEDYDNIVTSQVETDYENLWVKTAADVEGWTQRTEAYAPYSAPIQLYDMLGVPFDDERWVEFMNQLTWAEMISVLDYAGFRSEAIPSIGKEVSVDNDGPGQIKDAYGSGQIGNRVEGDPANKVVQAYDGHGQAWVCAVVVASTWNEELAYQQGLMIGEESIMYGINGWYAPATNIHRSPFAGRNFEYYSQDGFHAGVIAAAVSKGCVEKGMHVYVKHSFLNDQETNRSGLVTFATEQAIRQIYAKPFEMAIRAGANGTMASFNRIGVMTSVNYAVSIQLYVNEWGLDGFNITDWYNDNIGWTFAAMNRAFTVPLNHPNDRAGNNPDTTWDPSLNDGQGGVLVPSWNPQANNGQGAIDNTNKVQSYTAWYWTRMSSQKVLYTLVNGNSMQNGYRDHYFQGGTVNYEFTQNAQVPNNQINLLGSYADKIKEALGENGYTLTILEGPKGLTINNNGVLAGTPYEAGNGLTLKVKLQGLGGQHYIRDIEEFKLNITPVLKYNVVSGEVGKHFRATLSSPINFANIVDYEGEPVFELNGKIINFKLEVTGLPKGLEYDKWTGTITGKPLEAGQHTVKVAISGTSVSYMNWWGMVFNTSSNFEYATTFTLDIAGGKNVIVFDEGNYEIITSADNDAKITPPEVERYGYKFLGWALAEDETNTLVNFDNYTVNGQVAFKAVWEALNIENPEWTQGEDGYWYHFGQKTDKMWRGVDGETGAPGTPGPAGPKGQDATVGNILGIISFVIVVLGGGAFLVATLLRKPKAN